MTPKQQCCEGKDMSYQLELGQMMFGQPYKDYPVSNFVDAALCRIRDEIDRVMRNIHQREYASPFANTGNAFKCDAFEVHAYSWADEPQPFNFKWRDIEISWYKYLGRGMSANVELSPEMVAEMLDACLAAVIQYEEVARKESKDA